MEQLSLFSSLEGTGGPQRPVVTAVKAALAPVTAPSGQGPAEVIRLVWPKLQIAVPNGEVGKYDSNIEAIKLLKVLKAEDRVPTAGERKTLNAYSGWGSLGQKFAAWQEPWKSRVAALDELLSEPERASVRASVNNAHYTPQDVIDAMWQVVERLGFKGGRILDPSAGTGFFIGAMPTNIARRSNVTAVEIDTISAGITEKLYGSFGAKVHACGFERAPLVDGFYDLAISNVPFGSYKVVDAKHKTYSRFSIHNYFFAKALDLVRPGGLVAFVTSTFSMDRHDSSVRQYLAKRARLVGAFRLPSSAFAQVAGTSVTTDVVVLQRLASDADGNRDEWLETVQTEAPLGLMYSESKPQINQWYEAHADRLVGKLTLVRNGYQRTLGVEFNGDLQSALREQVAKFPEGIYHPQAQAKPATPKARKREDAGEAKTLPPGSFVVKEDGTLWIREGEAQMVEAGANGKKAERIAGLIGVRDAARELVAGQVSPSVPSVALGRMREKLNAAYDAFVRKHGAVHERGNRQVFSSDPSMPLLLSLEVEDENTHQVAKADIFRRRTAGGLQVVHSCDSLTDAISVVKDRSGSLDVDEMAGLLEKSEAAVRSDLLERGLAFVDPTTSELVEADVYLSGNVREKLRVAEAAQDGFEANVAALKKVIPADLAPNEIRATLGSTWIPESDYTAWITELLGKEVGVSFSANTGAWQISATKWDRQNGSEGALKFGTSRIDAYTLIEQALNQQVPTIRDRDPYDRDKYVTNAAATLEARERQEALKKEFSTWVWQDDARAQRLARLYNDTFNCYAPWEPDGSHMTLPGYSQWHKLHAHQVNAIWRVVAGGRNALLGHVVGAGKTLTMVCAGMELRRLGKARKPMYVVPNHMLEQFSVEFLRAYPAANILVASKADFQGDKRRVLLSRIATGDWDAVVVTHSTFERIKLAPDYLKGYIEDRVDEIVAELEALKGDRGMSFKELQRAKKVWEARLERLAAGKEKDDVLSFDELGVDWLFVDEAHLFKNLYRFTKMSRVAGLPNSNAERAFDMLLKTRCVMERRGSECGVVFATGTPVSNSMAEMWVMQHYLQPAALERADVRFFDAWATNFGEVVTAIELAPDGSRYRTNARFARFVNLPELMGMFAEVADVKTAEMLRLPVPEATKEVVVAKASAALKEYVAGLVDRVDKIHDGNVDPREDNMLKVTNDGRKAALDMRLVDPDAEDTQGSKVNLCVENVYGIWRETADNRGTQLLFCDLSTPGKVGFDVYHDVKAKLMRKGVPEAEIAFIHDYDTDAAKERLFESVRSGAVRILLGSTTKMGVGTNVQTRLVALHHLDAPWRPADVEQREGRIIRQGNSNANVRLFRYVTEGSFDSYIWQTLETKAKFIAQVMSGDRAMRTAEDLELAALSYAEVKALASGNPMVLEKAGIDAEVAKLSVLRSQHDRKQWDLKQAAKWLPERIEHQQAYIAKLDADLEAVALMDDGAELVIGGQHYTDADGMAGALEEARKRFTSKASAYRLGEESPVGTFGSFGLGFKLKLCLSAEGSRVIAVLHGKSEYEHEVPKTGRFILTAVKAALADVAGERDHADAALADYRVRLDAVRSQVGKPFEHADRLASLLQRQEDVNKALGVFESDHSGLGEEPDAAAA
ncbi:MAG: DEAD/DEAH box helicase [Rhodanobacteraceae bacterium]|nr:MAG: DEAD/DEAH box helicase [Rhodanobacteraceae bacterium]